MLPPWMALFLGLSGSSYVHFLSNTELPGDQSRRQLYYIMWCNYFHDREGMRVRVPREKDFSLNPMRAYKRPTNPWKVICGSLPSMRYHRFCHFGPFIPKRIPPAVTFSPPLTGEIRICKNSISLEGETYLYHHGRYSIKYQLHHLKGKAGTSSSVHSYLFLSPYTNPRQ